MAGLVRRRQALLRRIDFLAGALNGVCGVVLVAGLPCWCCAGPAPLLQQSGLLARPGSIPGGTPYRIFEMLVGDRHYENVEWGPTIRSRKCLRVKAEPQTLFLKAERKGCESELIYGRFVL